MTNNVSIGIAILVFVTVIGIAYYYSEGDLTTYKNKIEQIPKLVTIDEYGNEVGNFLAPPPPDILDKYTESGPNIVTSSVPLPNGSKQSFNYSTVNETVSTYTFGQTLETVSYGKEIPNYLDRLNAAGIPIVKRGETVIINGYIKILDPVTEKQIPPPYFYNVLLTCCEGDNAVYADSFLKTQSNGVYQFSYKTSGRDILGEYRLEVTTASPESTSKYITHIIKFIVVEP